MSTLGHQYDNSLVSNAFGFLRLPLNFQPYDSDADWVITGVPFDMATSGRAGRRSSSACHSGALALLVEAFAEPAHPVARPPRSGRYSSGIDQSGVGALPLPVGL